MWHTTFYCLVQKFISVMGTNDWKHKTLFKIQNMFSPLCYGKTLPKYISKHTNSHNFHEAADSSRSPTVFSHPSEAQHVFRWILVASDGESLITQVALEWAGESRVTHHFFKLFLRAHKTNQHPLWYLHQGLRKPIPPTWSR